MAPVVMFVVGTVFAVLVGVYISFFGAVGVWLLATGIAALATSDATEP